jgi:hypothetical protein
MSAPYPTGELPMVGDLIDLNHGRSVLAKVLVVVGGSTEGAAPGQSVESCRECGPGVLVQIQGPGGGALVFEEPNDDTILVQRAV